MHMLIRVTGFLEGRCGSRHDTRERNKYTGYIRKVFDHFNKDFAFTYSLWNKI